jgi:hypothetical protein
MKRLLVAILCLVALSPLASGMSKKLYRPSAQDKSAQEEKKATVNYDDYAGQYEVTKDFILTITNDKGNLMVQPSGDDKAEFKAEDKADQFSSAAVNARLKFVRDPEGKVFGVIVTLDGKEFQAKKIK